MHMAYLPSLLFGILLILFGFVSFYFPDQFALIKGGFARDFLKKYDKSETMVRVKRTISVLSIIVGVAFILSYFGII